MALPKSKREREREKQELLAQMVSNKVEDTINRLKLYQCRVSQQYRSSGNSSQD